MHSCFPAAWRLGFGQEGHKGQGLGWAGWVSNQRFSFCMWYARKINRILQRKLVIQVLKKQYSVVIPPSLTHSRYHPSSCWPHPFNHLFHLSPAHLEHHNCCLLWRGEVGKHWGKAWWRWGKTLWYWLPGSIPDSACCRPWTFLAAAFPVADEAEAIALPTQKQKPKLLKTQTGSAFSFSTGGGEMMVVMVVEWWQQRSQW